MAMRRQRASKMVIVLMAAATLDCPAIAKTNSVTTPPSRDPLFRQSRVHTQSLPVATYRNRAPHVISSSRFLTARQTQVRPVELATARPVHLGEQVPVTGGSSKRRAESPGKTPADHADRQ